MKNLSPNYFFELAKFKHRSLFDGCSYVWQAITNITKYLASYDLGKIEVEVPEGVYLIDPEKISIGKGTILEPGAYIKGPCIIGENCTVRHGAYIRGDFICGDDCVIGHTTEVKNSVFLNKAFAGHFAYIGESILGNRINLGAGTKCANFRLDHRPVYLKIEGQKIETGMRKFGAIIGDDSQTGCNSVLNPGTLFGQKVFCYPGVNVSGFVPSSCIVKTDESLVIIPYPPPVQTKASR